MHNRVQEIAEMKFDLEITNKKLRDEIYDLTCKKIIYS